MEERNEKKGGQSQKTQARRQAFLQILASMKNSTTQKKKIERGWKKKQVGYKKSKKRGVTIVYSEQMFHVKHLFFVRPVEGGLRVCLPLS